MGSDGWACDICGFVPSKTTSRHFPMYVLHPAPYTPALTDGVRPLDVGHLRQWTKGTATCFREDVFFMDGRSAYTGFSLADCMHAHECESERRERRERRESERGRGRRKRTGIIAPPVRRTGIHLCTSRPSPLFVVLLEPAAS